jgi:hypothetical protein
MSTGVGLNRQWQDCTGSSPTGNAQSNGRFPAHRFYRPLFGSPLAFFVDEGRVYLRGPVGDNLPPAGD